ncbi:MAG: type II toxin-antitoxin system HicB family antitoxin [Acidobacteriota bacterium]|nr:type II toxin-antitoxin system HicB family antitoxin [Acidobacteriota bacterium]
MKIGVSLSGELLTFADEEARRRGLTRSGFLAELLRAEQIRKQASAYIDRHGWDVAEDDSAWHEYQAKRMAQEYGDDEW